MVNPFYFVSQLMENTRGATSNVKATSNCDPQERRRRRMRNNPMSIKEVKIELRQLGK